MTNGWCRGLAVSTLLASVSVCGVAGAQQNVAEGGGSPRTSYDTLLNRRVSVRLRNASMPQALAAVAKAANIQVLYRIELVSALPLVSANLTNRPLGDVFGYLLADAHLRAVAVSGDVISIDPIAQTGGEILGRVTDSATHNPIAGAVVALRGRKASVVTTKDGVFAFHDVPAGPHVVMVRFLGYTSSSRSVDVDEKLPIRVTISLTPAVTVLSGVVSTATGTQRKIEVGNDITTLNVDSILRVAPITNVTDLLDGRVPGLTVQRSSGSPGDPSRIRLRGAASIFQNNDPIVVVDGIRVYNQQSDARNAGEGRTRNASGAINGSGTTSYATPAAIDQIDPNTIETIEVLKGPSASSMYGSDAANGVIVITTKRGQAGPARWSVSVDQGVSTLPGTWPQGQWVWGTAVVGGYPVVCLGVCPGNGTVDSTKTFQALNDPRYTALGTGSNRNVSTTVSGGSSALQYALTMSGGTQLGLLRLPRDDQSMFAAQHGYNAPDWMTRPEQLQQWSASGSLTVQVNDRTNVTVASLLGKQSQHKTSMSNEYGTAVSALEAMYIDPSVARTTPLLGNPFERVTSDVLTLTNSVHIGSQIFSWLPVDGTFGVSNQFKDNQNLLGRGLMLTATDSTGFFLAGHNASTNYSGTLNSTIPVRGRLALAAGLNYTNAVTNDFSGSFSNLPLGVNDPTSGQDATKNTFTRQTTGQQTFGWFLEPRLNVASRFFVMPGFRLDNNGLSGSNAKFMGLPKLNLSYVVSDEPFFPTSIVSMLRVRGAFGAAGVQPSPQDGLRLYNGYSTGTGNSALNNAYGNFQLLSQMGNTHLRPERGNELEAGFDADVWNGRLSLTFTQYNKLRKNAIIDNPLATSIGGGVSKINLGDIRNRGTELSVTAQLIERQAIGWNVNLNLSHNQSKVLRLGNDYRAIVNTLLLNNSAQSLGLYYVPGYPMNAIWEHPIYGYADLNHDGKITSEEVLVGTDTVNYMGSADPSLELGFGSGWTLLHGRLSVNASFNYVGGVTQSDIKDFTQIRNGVSGITPFVLAANDPTLSAEQQAAIAAWQLGPSVGTNYGLIQRTNTLRVQALSISANLGPRVARLIGAGSASIALQGANLWTWTNYIGKDPDVNAFSTGQMTGDFGQLPMPRTWTLRMTVGR